MARAGSGAQVVTANRLTDGAVVWLGPADDWVDRVDRALVVEGAEATAALALAQRAAAANLVVEPYLIEVAVGPEGVRPQRYRERIRAHGPTVRLDLGKQAETLP